MAELTFYFDYGSPYSYLGWQRLRRHADRYAGHTVRFVPVSAGHIFRNEGGKPNAEHPNLKTYNDVDCARWAAAYAVPIRFPPGYPNRSLDAARVHHHLDAKAPSKAAEWMTAVFTTQWIEGRRIDDAAVLAELAGRIGVDLAAARQDPEAKARFIAATDAAYAAGAPGVPYVVLDGEGYWGNDRLDWVEARLAGRTAPQGL